MSISRLAAPVVGLVVAIAMIVVVNTARLQHVRAVTAAGDQVSSFDPKSPTGYAGQVRSLVLPNRDAAAYQWIVQTQQGAARGTWRVRHVDYDNAPFGRSVLTPSLYRWWLACIGHVRNLFSSTPLAVDIEQGALWANPALEIVGLVLLTVFVLVEFGGAAATVVAIAGAFVYPFAGAFLGADPNDMGFALLTALGTLLAALASIRRSDAPATAASQRCFAAAGILAGITLWLNAALGGSLAIAMAVGAIVAEVFAPRDQAALAIRRSGWVTWSLWAAATTLLAAILEYFPEYLDGWHLEYIHPVYGFAWLGLGGILAWTYRSLAAGRPAIQWRSLAMLVVSLACVVGPIVIGVHNGSFAAGAASLALNPTHLEGASGSEPIWHTISRRGSPAAWVSLLVPLAVIVAGIVVAWRARAAEKGRTLWFGVACAIVLLIAGLLRLAWLGLAEAAVIALLVPLAALTVERMWARLVWIVAGLAVVGLGSWLLRNEAGGSSSSGLTEPEVVALVERDLSQWLAGRAGPGGAVVLAPPSLSASLYYHGNLRVLGTPYWENKDGMQAAVRLSAASSPDEALALAGKREVRFIAIPSWDPALDRLVKLTSNAPDKSLLGMLHQWQAPRWLRPLPYPIPAIPGFEGRSVAVFEVVEVQENAVALSRLAECFVEMGRLEDGGRVASAIGRAFPGDLSVHIARANVAAAFGDNDRLAEDLKVLTNAESLANATSLPWDREVSYAIALANGQRLDLARQITEKLLTEIDETKIRFLTPQSLYRLQLLCKVSGLEISDPKLRTLARELLPPEVRDKV